jgi:mannose-6-phosphate isomerase-like protein (cupin superfamily)
MYDIADKVWGRTWLVFRGPGFSVHFIEYKQGMACSWHKHRSKANFFYVLSGLLQIHERRPDGTCDITVLPNGGGHMTPPGRVHRFYGEQSGSALEIYWGEMEEDDITRLAPGGPVSPEELGKLNRRLPYADL